MSGRGLSLTHCELQRRPYPRMFRFVLTAFGDELEHLVGFLEHFVDVDALDCGEAVFDEESVGLPIRRVGAAICCCNIFEGFQTKAQVER